MANANTYDIGGVEYPRVTTILSMLDKSAGLIPWAVKMALTYVEQHAEEAKDWKAVLLEARDRWREARDEAADIGSEVHQLIKAYIRHGRDAVGNYRPEVENGFLAFLEWEKENDIEWLQSEWTVHHGEAGYAGTADAKGRARKGPYADKVILLDFKSSKAVWDEHRYQVAAYHLADIWGGTEHPADVLAILRLDKETGAPEFVVVDKVEQHAAFFLALTKAYYLQRDRRLKGNPLTLGAQKRATEGPKSLRERRTAKAAEAELRRAA